MAHLLEALFIPCIIVKEDCINIDLSSVLLSAVCSQEQQKKKTINFGRILAFPSHAEEKKMF
jgi:hypothetical protein